MRTTVFSVASTIVSLAWASGDTGRLQAQEVIFDNARNQVTRVHVILIPLSGTPGVRPYCYSADPGKCLNVPVSQRPEDVKQSFYLVILENMSEPGSRVTAHFLLRVSNGQVPEVASCKNCTLATGYVREDEFECDEHEGYASSSENFKTSIIQHRLRSEQISEFYKLNDSKIEIPKLRQ
jgi:hypothetical protein